MLDDRRTRTGLTAALATLALLAIPGGSPASTSHAGWPEIDMLLINKHDEDRPLDARPGMDPFGGEDPTYSCDGEHKKGKCQNYFTEGAERVVKPGLEIHNELLGGHGDDTLHGGDHGDVLWGDYKGGGQPTSQRDSITGGAAKDFIYASHGRNTIDAGGGADYVKAHYGRGTVDCGAGKDTLYISRKVQPKYTIRGCERISHKTLGY